MPDLVVAPLTIDRWGDFEKLFGARGACGGCWCMTPRLSRTEYERNKGEGNRRAMEAIVRSGEIPGILGYLEGEAIAWCAVAPRERFSWLERSRLFRPVDDRPVWSIVCLFIDRRRRNRGVSVGMIESACRFAASEGARWVEAYPVEPKSPQMPPVFAWHGIASAFRRAGFEEVVRRSSSRPIMRFEIDRSRA
ncbi:MAG TPA: GNAT family N-acetyltransferase [Thiotrichales bacterium]|nr:GNAT family N-acetyltransferase [Thiotrichales bacterium]